MEFYQKLRELTRPFHSLVDSNFFASALMRGEVSKEIYGDFLAKMYAVHKGVEEVVWGCKEEFLKIGVDIEGFKRSEDIAFELDKMGVAPKSGFDTLFLNSFGAVLAGYYVLEGSKNGALQIYPRLVESLGELEFRYFAISPDFRRSFSENMRKLFSFIEREGLQKEVILKSCEFYLRLEEWLA